MGNDGREEVTVYVDAVRTVIENLTVLRPSEQRDAVIGHQAPGPVIPLSAEELDLPTGSQREGASRAQGKAYPKLRTADGLLELARATAADGRQRGAGATNPAELELLGDTARGLIGELPVDDAARSVLPWLWKGEGSTGRALTPEGEEFGYELRFSRYKTMQIKP